MDSEISGWWVRFPEKMTGPFSLEQLQKLVANGRVTPNHLVSSDRVEWQPASLVAGLDFQLADTARVASRGAGISVNCNCGNTFSVATTFAKAVRPCPKCGSKCRVPSATVVGEWSGIAGAAEGSHGTTRPAFFGALTAAGLAWSTFGFIYFLALPFLFGTNPARGNEVVSLTVVGLLFTLGRLLVFFELRDGKRWAWVAIQVLAATETLFLLLAVAAVGPQIIFLSIVQILIYFCIVPILYTLKVQEFFIESS
jgi:GYF domain 2